MTKTILIPTDLTVESLNSVRIVLEEHSRPVKIIMVCPVYMPDSLTELLYYRPQKAIEGLMTSEFRDGLAILKNRFENVLESINVEIFHGLNRSAFVNFVEAKEVDEIVVPANYKLKKLKNGFDILPYIKKSNNPVTTVEWSVRPSSSSSSVLHLFGG